ncbi:MBL fold metallo-hydrolase [Paenibacillus sp. FSL H8-0317]|uniref:MBL fold metallo-hydrolase n=1 Tax=Paenibacillus TaxID=44249 RepID=UPI00097020F5|nr:MULTISPECIES: MBL fold metallo-hydrolase [Paenibacillus]MBY0119545.1 MBL fold metallo-hydrolase [Paenibacillus xylanexedens]OMF54973.1 MBL fold metallo-hydrolase [Paenibacillus sp. FSL R5-0765]
MTTSEYKVISIKSSYEAFINYSYIVVDETTREAAVIDPSWDLEAILDSLEAEQAKLTHILLTHSHTDHVHLVGALLDRFNPQVYMGGAEIDFFRYHCKNLKPVKDRDAVLMGNTLISCINTPGHTPGSICYSLTNHIFTGDTLFAEGCGICSERGGDPGAMYQSLQKIRQQIHPSVRVYPAHSFGIEPGQTLQMLLERNIYFNIFDEEQFIAFRMRRNQPDAKSFV